MVLSVRLISIIWIAIATLAEAQYTCVCNYDIESRIYSEVMLSFVVDNLC